MKYLNDVSYKDCIGKVCKSLNSGDFKILKCNGSKNVDVQFLKTGYETATTLDNIRKGYVKDPYLLSVYGAGILGTKYLASINTLLTKEYELWSNMLKRCYSDFAKKKQPTYIGFGVEGFELDKDLLIKDNKVYSENACVFIPSEINTVLTKRVASRGEYPIGVYWHSKSKAFVAQVGKNKGKQEHLVLFNTELEAYNAYKTAKESFIKELANKFKSQIDERVYDALINYEVNIDD